MIPYIIRTFRGGVSDETDKGVSGSFKYGENLEIHKRRDSLTCASTMATIDESTITDLIVSFVPAKDGTTYAFGNTGRIYSIAGSIDDPVVSLKATDSNGAIKGAAEWQLSDGNNYLFWATNTSLARKLLPGDDAWGDVSANYKTTLNSADWHTMRNASGTLMIANGNGLSTVDYAGNFIAEALNIRPGNLVKSIEERDDYVILGSFRADNSEEGHIWSWVTTATNYVEKKRIPVKGVNAMISAELMLLQGGEDGEIFFSDFVDAVPLHGIPLGGQVNPNGVAIEDDLAIFGFYGGTYPGIWSYGRKRKNRPYALNYNYRLAKDIAGSTISTIGAVAVVNGLVLVSWGTTDGSTSDYGVDMVSSTTRATGVYEGLEFDNQAPHLRKMIKSLKVTTAPLPASTSYSMKFKTDYETDWRYAVLGDGSTTYSVENSVQSIFILGRPAFVYEVGVELNPSGSSTPEILSITSYLEEEAKDYA